MREQEMREIKLHGVTKSGLKNIIDFIYTSKVSLDMGNLQDTLEAANFLQVMPVLRFCNQLLSSEVRGFNVTLLHQYFNYIQGHRRSKSSSRPSHPHFLSVGYTVQNENHWE